jgi:predicted  nucleic acid-binding Zn-ribbon protein
VELRHCPYDAAPVEIERVRPDAVLVGCPDCGARWEWHNAYLRRIEEPDREAVRRRRAERALDNLRAGDERLRAHVRR